MAYTDNLAIFAYLMHNLDLEKAVKEYHTAMNRLLHLPAKAAGTFGPFTEELLHQSRSKLLYLHIREGGGGGYKPARIRELLEESISLFPHNTIFLSLFAWNESRFRIEGRVRHVMRAITSGTSSGITAIDSDQTATTQQVPVTSHLFAIYTELNRPIYAGSTAHSVRAAFENAIGESNAHDESGRHLTNEASSSANPARSNLSIWKLYILFELDRNDIQRAKNIFYRAIRACPWSKELVMLAFAYFRSDVVDARDEASSENVSSPPRRGRAMDFFELRRVYNVLVEKELRVHVDIERLLDDTMLELGRKLSLPAMPIDNPDDGEDDPML